MLGRTLAALVAAVALFSSTADAAIIQDRGPLLSATNGIALGPDGNFWVAEQFSDSVARMTPAGAVLNRYSVGVGPTTVAAGPGGRVWVSVTGADKLVWFDATSASPAPHDVLTGGTCGPVGLVSGPGDRMFFSLPDDGCGGGSRLGSVAADGTGLMTIGHPGLVFSLATASGKLYAPDFSGDVVRRVAPGALNTETAINAPGGSSPDGITVDGAGNLWVTLFSSGRVGTFPAAQDGGPLTEITPTGGTLQSPFGIVAGNDGRIYVTGKDSKNVARVDASGSTWQFYATGGEPWQIVNGPDGDLFFTDQSSTRVLRFLSGAPRASTGAATAQATTVVSATATVDTRGNATQVVFDYGPTAAYGATSAPITLPAADGGAPVTAVLSGLAPGTTYHVRVRAANEEGSVAGADTTVGTPAPPPAPPKVLAARTSFSWSFVGSRTVLRKVDITGLTGGETAVVTCKGKGCPFKTKTYKNLKKGKKALGSKFGRKHKLRKGAKIEVRVSKPDTIGSSAIATIRGRKQDPRITRSCLAPGAKKTSRCPT
jgi:streptogramin lyase